MHDMTNMRKLGTKVIASITDHFSVSALSQAQASIQQWFSSPLGQQVLTAEQQTLDRIMPEIYGYHLMQLSVLNDVTLSSLSPVTHHFSLGVTEKSGQPAVAEFEQLPIEAESVDTVLLHHVLEYSTKPHQLLREAAYTIIPNGYLIIVGFNPISPLAVKKQWGRLFSPRAHWRYHGIGHGRLSDWLRVLNFEPVFLQFGFHGLPFAKGHHKAIDSAIGRALPFSGVYYVIAARKSISPMKLIRQPRLKVAKLPMWAKGSTIPTQTTATHRQERKKW
ncbi:MAG: SAM-dependent methyltransferase [Cellvibrionaceae bacterium]|jgi:SAM-dependent methyltransferase